MGVSGKDNPFSQGAWPLILDGGLATELEARGFDLDDPLWSARVLIDAPEAIRETHMAYLRAGADCITSASYQASVPGFARAGLCADESRRLLQLSVALAVQARDAFWAVPDHRRGRRRPLVAASVGPYGAYLADGSEYSGAYAADDETLYAFHRDRLQLLAQTGADLLACETIPSAREVAVLARLLGEMPECQAWVSVCCGDGSRLWDGSAIEEVGTLCEGVSSIAAVGINCVAPGLVTPLLRRLRGVTSKPLLAYPNRGERYDPAGKRWCEDRSAATWSTPVPEWLGLGMGALGGCCRVGPEQIRELRGEVARAFRVQAP